MASRLLRNIAVSIGAGLAIGLKRRTPRSLVRPSPNFNPILERLDTIENRVARVELSPPPPIITPAPEEIEAIGTLVCSQAEDIAALREDLAKIERRNIEQAEAFGQKIAALERQVPVTIEAAIAARMAELEHRLRGEFQDIHYRTVDAFAETIENRVINRINHLENNLIEQSHSILALREKSYKTEDNLERLLHAVERLAERAEERMPVPVTVIPQTLPAPEPGAPPPVHQEPALEIDRQPEPVLHEQHPPGKHRRAFEPIGVAILGLAILGFRLIR